MPAPLTHHDQAEQLKQARQDWHQIDGVENPFDQDLNHADGHDDAGGFAKLAHLVPVDLVEGGIDLAEHIAVALGEVCSGVAGGINSGLGALLLHVGRGVAHGPQLGTEMGLIHKVSV